MILLEMRDSVVIVADADHLESAAILKDKILFPTYFVGFGF
jgi:hypothetical protein